MRGGMRGILGWENQSLNHGGHGGTQGRIVLGATPPWMSEFGKELIKNIAVVDALVAKAVE
jgi:hypothetical protein